MSTTTLTCSKCGSTAAAGTRFCGTCGTDLLGPRLVVPDNAPTTAIETDELLPLVIEATLGEYDIYGLLGRGGMATVYLALDIALNRKVAIKVMNPQMLMGEDAIARFRREAQTAANLQHPHVIPIHAVKQTPKLVFFVMKYVEGQPLDAIIKQVRMLPVETTVSILSQVAGALQYAHKRGIVHRDIKPANIMIDEDGQAIVTDFGIAKVQEAKGLTMTGATVGTPAYMSPEQYEGKNIAGAADQYSLGIVAYEMLTGRTPFGGDSIMTMMKGHLLEPPPPITEARQDLPSHIASTVMRMLEKRAEDRFPDLAAVVAALDAKILADSHPARTQLVELAKTGAMMRPRMSVPLSPIPSPKAPKPAAANAAGSAAARPTPGAAPSAASPKTSNGLVIAGAALALVAAGGGWFFLKGGAAAPSIDPAAVAATPPAAAPTPASVARDSAAAATAVTSTGANTPAPAEPAPRAEEPKAVVAATKPPATNARKESTKPAAKPPATKPTAAPTTSAESEMSELAMLRQGRTNNPTVANKPAAPASGGSVGAAPPPAAATAASASAAEGKLKIASSVDDATLIIDGTSRGTLGTAPRTISLKPGVHQFVVKKDGCVDATGSFTIDADATFTIGKSKASPVCP
ncbi:MAG: serine/threonine-protein kinase [Gemmatimonadaceae bacterium]|nr:serine/threonine-protein kinase [Gemmatimonadaceae bacterium]